MDEKPSAAEQLLKAQIVSLDERICFQPITQLTLWGKQGLVACASANPLHFSVDTLEQTVPDISSVRSKNLFHISCSQSVYF